MSSTYFHKTYVSYVDESKYNVGAGIDNILGVFINNCRESINVPLTNIFSKSLREGTFPRHLTGKKLL